MAASEKGKRELHFKSKRERGQKKPELFKSGMTSVTPHYRKPKAKKGG